MRSRTGLVRRRKKQAARVLSGDVLPKGCHAKSREIVPADISETDIVDRTARNEHAMARLRSARRASI
jgi:hypothetical protein